MPERPLSIYIHIPFCAHRCAYCDFNTFAGVDHLIPSFVNALSAEIEQLSQYDRKDKVKTIFFGGGTPSLLEPKYFEQIFNSLEKTFDLSTAREISLEANPGTVVPGYFRSLRSIGFNRVSLGVQSADPRFLRFLERIHDHRQVLDSIDQIRQAGIDNINLDLIYGIPGQSLSDLEKDIKIFINSDTPHLSMYSLGIESGTPLGKWYKKGLIEVQDDDLIADQYQLARQLLVEAGYEHYEISNWAKPGKQCEHNLAYWRADNYLGFGPGAHGHFNGTRYSVIKGLRAYISSVAEKKQTNSGRFPITSATDEFNDLTPMEQLQDHLMVGLRLLKEGISKRELEARYQIDLDQTFGEVMNKLKRNDLLIQKQDRYYLTEKAYFIGNQVFMEFMDP